MEVTRISQGRRNSTDYNLNTVVKETNADTPMLPPIEPIKSQNKDFSKEDMKVSVEKLNKFLQGENVHAEYEMHEKLNQIMIKIVNTDTKEVIMEIPPRKIIDMVAKMCEMVGLLVDKKA
ncbi:flagellar protein FlaG [Clostridium algidicarnis]|uniref:flagellar protein FlaG n=1 Tax=Clostridium algidicarnis TaxID=37659 RepID=UPI001C0C76FE|nr:flagellar protein FlaG [Clostridium algidicarnis]MBU3195841.1 flagellar protein FlaG [Clostridium algidicarnis]